MLVQVVLVRLWGWADQARALARRVPDLYREEEAQASVLVDRDPPDHKVFAAESPVSLWSQVQLSCSYILLRWLNDHCGW